VITATAQGLANNTTTLYAGAWSRITNSTVTPATQATRYSRFDALGGGNTPALDTTGLPATTADPVIGTFTAGVGTLTFGSGTGLLFARATPVAPFNADIALALNVIDTDNVAYASNPAAFGAATAGSGIAFGSGKPMRFGRLTIRSANGSQLVPLPVQVEAQYWLGAPNNAFVTNTADSCTSIAAGNVAMSNFTNNLSGSPTCQTAISGGGALSAGRRTLQLAAPGSANNGGVNLTVNLGASASGTTCTTVGAAPVSATTANRPYLQGNWTGGAYNVNPSARATFGVYKGSDEVIFIRENF
jgi:MSHA biogenesis protein MshQ